MGVICRYCNLRMGDGQGCTLTAVVIEGRIHQRIPYLSERETWPLIPVPMPELCHDCETALGKLHHLGCDMEACPRCGDALFLCGCLDYIPGPGHVLK